MLLGNRIEDARLWLDKLKKLKLTMLEVSDDPFHHGEEIENPAKRTKIAAKELNIHVNSICINPPTVEQDHNQEKGKPIYKGGPKLRGRAVDKLIKDLPKTSFKNFTQCPFEDLRDPGRVHIDAFGNVLLCQGLSMGNMWKTPLSKLIKTYDPDAHPICGPLLKNGPIQLAKAHGLDHEKEYVDACHMCSAICLKLIDKYPQYLAPRQVYGLK